MQFIRSEHRCISFLFLLSCLLSCSSAYNYLVVLPTSVRSHYNVGSALAKGLAAAGHQVTIISPFETKKPHQNITEIAVPSILEAMKASTDNLLETSEKPILNQILGFYEMGINITKALLEDPTIKEFKKSKQTFDAVICEVFLNEALFGFAEHFNAPLIGLGTFGAISWNTDLVGSPSPPSYIPHALLKFSDHMSLVERVGNLAFLTYEEIFMNLYYLPKQEEVYRKYFPNNKQDFYDMRKNTALVLLNQHVSLSFPRPYSPNMIEVGGMHINRKRQPLPKDIEDFINGAEHGVIYFSMGSNLKSKNLPLEKRQALIETFGKLKQRVLWKFEDTNMPGKPANVFISDWFPQDDILAHKNVIAFITHGGLLSTTESIYHGKPFVGIPIFGDQFLNMARAESNGYGVTVNFKELTTEKLTNAIERIISTPEATQKVLDMSARYKDQKELPLERAVYWVEHVSRHKGAKYLRSASQDLNFVQYHNLDAILILYGGIIFILYCLMLLIRLAFRGLQEFFINRNSKASQDKSKKRN
ncbi:UDP-glycosyltransferase UGT5-like isoform X2 [Drosophila willistoni]|uniref:UDP-glycosyltransferase UGT5-like isoform X2 n=1 Tax=Drosophila willistoni TaxID=7260 RepID=UPI00017D937E|nr:UDP-glycosyltransferase UGT5-like isoform X2 [Drosophila willistoni]